jgi:Fe/S biogenesis protein NfuA
MINPNLASHGGFVELLDVESNNIYVRMGGGCQGCGAADMTMKMGIERMLREEIPQIGEVLDVTDHAAGTNPYYSPAK